MNAFPIILKSKFGQVKIYRCKNKGSFETHTVCWRSSGGRKRENHAELDAAKARAKEILEDIGQGRVERSQTPTEKFMYYRMCEQMLGEATLLDAVNFYLKHNNSELKEISVPQIVEMFHVAQTQKIGTENRNLLTIRHHLNRIAKTFLGRFSDVTTQQLDEYINGIGNCGRTKVNHRRTLIALWSWAQDRGYAPTGKTVAQATMTPKVSAKNPGIIEPSVMRELLNKAPDDILPMLVLGGFAGIRSAEIARLRWEDFNWEEKVIVLSGEITKRQRRRTVPITMQIENLLSKFHGKSGLVLNVDPYKELSKLTEVWVHNGLRHSYISYAMAKHKNAPMIAEYCGNSETEVQRSYKALVSEKQATEWFELEKQGNIMLTPA